MSGSSNKYLKLTKWFHGTTLDAWNEICENGIIAKHNIVHELDFGYGFYLTPKKEQAEKFIKSMLKIRQQDNKIFSELGIIEETAESRLSQIGVIIEFTFSPSQWIQDGSYNYKLLNAYDDEFADFVFHNRIENSEGKQQHNFDFIFGVMSDSNPIIDVARFKNGEIGHEDVKESFKVNTSAKQISIHNQSLCDIINPTNVYIIETGEELNVDDYFNKRKSGSSNKTII